MNTLSESATTVRVRGRAAHLESQVDQLYNNAHLGFIATVVNSLILVGVLRGQVDPTLRWLWFVAVGVVTLTRLASVRAYRHARSQASFDAERWAGVFSLGLGVSGIIWGMSAVFLFPTSVAHQSFLAFVLGGMVAGAAATFSLRMESYLAFAVPALLPLVLRFSAVGDELHLAMGAMIFLFGALLSGTAYRVHTAVVRSLMMKDDLERSRFDLAESRQRIVSLSSELDGARSAVSVNERDTNERMIRYMDTLVDSFDTLQSRLERRFAAQFRVRCEKRRATSLTTLARGVSRELRGPLDVISKTLSLAWRDPDRLPPATALTRMFVQTEAATKDLNRVMGQLSRYAGHEPGATSAVDLSALARVVVGSWREESRYPGELWCSFSQVPSVQADAEQIAVVLEQLLTNASEAVRPEDAVIEVSTEVVTARDIDVSKAHVHESSAETFVALSIVDNGIGMTEATIDRIFDPFYTTKAGETGRGRGCGLATVAAVVRQHRGEIVVDSRTLAGSTFRVLLPVGD